MATFLSDTFTEASPPVDIASHSPNVGGTYTPSGVAICITGGTMRTANGISGERIVTNDATPGDADITINFDFVVKTTGAGDYTGFVCRASDASGTNCYLVRMKDNSYEIYNKQGASYNAVASGALALSAGTYACSWAVESALGTNTLIVDGVTKVNAVNDPNTPITAAGVAGFYLYNNSGDDNAGVQLDNVVFADGTGAGPATSYTFTGPSSGVVNVASTNFTLTPNGSYTGTITPASDGSGTFSPTSLTWSGTSDAKTFTYTPTSTTGSPHTLSVTSSPGLTDPASIDYTVNATANNIAVNDANLLYSPGNWKVSGSSFAVSANPRASVRGGFTGTSLKMTIDISDLDGATPSASDYPVIMYSIDRAAPTVYQIQSGDTQLTLASGLAGGTHGFEVILKALRDFSPAYDRWTTPANALKITTFELDGGEASAALPANIAARTYKALFFGDSITQGTLNVSNTQAPAGQDATQTWVDAVAAALDAEPGVIAFGSQGYNTGGSSGTNVPQFTDAWDFYYSGQSRLSVGLFAEMPDYVFVNHGTNGGVTGVQTQISDMRAALGGITGPSDPKLFIMVPFGGYNRSGITSAFNAYQTATPDDNTYLIDLGSAAQVDLDGGSGRVFSVDGVHPNIKRDAQLASMVVGAVQDAIGGIGGGGGGTLGGARRRPF